MKKSMRRWLTIGLNQTEEEQLEYKKKTNGPITPQRNTNGAASLMAGIVTACFANGLVRDACGSNINKFVLFLIFLGSFLALYLITEPKFTLRDVFDQFDGDKTGGKNYQRNFQFLQNIFGKEETEKTIRDLKILCDITENQWIPNKYICRNQSMCYQLSLIMENIDTLLGDPVSCSDPIITKQKSDEIYQDMHILRNWISYYLLEYAINKGKIMNPEIENLFRCGKCLNDNGNCKSSFADTMKELDKCLDIVEQYSNSDKSKRLSAAIKLYKSKLERTKKNDLSTNQVVFLRNYTSTIKKNYNTYDTQTFRKMGEGRFEFAEDNVLNFLIKNMS